MNLICTQKYLNVRTNLAIVKAIMNNYNIEEICYKLIEADIK